MTPITDDELAALETKHMGKIRLFQDPNDPPEWQVVLRKPNGKEAMTFRMSANNDARKAFAALDVIKSTVVWPEREGFLPMLEEFGLMPEGICNDPEWKKWVGLEVAQTAKR